MWKIAGKEISELLFSAKFVVIAAATFVLIGLSLFNGYTVYEIETRAVNVGERITEDEYASRDSYEQLYYSGAEVYRSPEKLAILDIGASGYIGRRSSTGTWSRGMLSESRYGQDPALGLFGELDLTFIVGSVLSLFALLFSYGSVCGERERGTLRLLLSNSVSRPSVIAGKLLGASIPIVLVYIVPLLLGMAVLTIWTGIDFSADEWLRLAMLVAIQVVYLLMFTAMGVAVSALTRSGFASFLVCLLLWIMFIAVIPKLTVQEAAQVTPTMSAEEYENRAHSLWRGYSSTYPKFLKEAFDEIRLTEDEMAERGREVYELAHDRFMGYQREEREKLNREFRMKRRDLMSTAAAFSMASPLSCLRLSSQALARSGPLMMERLEEEIERYSREFGNWARAMRDRYESDDQVRGNYIRFSRNEDGTMKIEIDEDYEPPQLDLSSMPRFAPVMPEVQALSSDALPYLGVLLFATVVFFAIAFVAFIRYDAR